MKFFGGAALAVLVSAALVAPAYCFSLNDLNPFGKKKYEMKVEPIIPPAQTYNKGLRRLKDGDYGLAAKTFSSLQKQYPFSEWARKALMMELYAYYKKGSYIEASTAADRYVQLYPNAPDVDYADYLAGMAMFSNLPDVERDQNRVKQGLKYFQAIVKKYPKSKYAADARFKIQLGRDQLAAHVLEVGRYYLKREDYPAAIGRFREVLFKYQDTREAEEALERLTEAYLALGVINEAETAAAVLGRNYPQSKWYHQAYERLKENGASPHEHQDSWISKAFKKMGMT